MRRLHPRRACRTIGGSAVGALLLVAGADAAELKPRTGHAWSVYVLAMEQRIAGELTSDQGFLAQDVQYESAGARAKLRRGDVLVSKIETRDGDGSRIGIPKGAVHHWRGSVFIPSVSLDDVLHGASPPGL